MSFDFTPFHPAHVPAPAPKWTGFPEFNFVGGHIDGATVPLDDLRAAMDRGMAKAGGDIATYYLQSGPQGYLPLREYLVTKLKKYAGIDTTTDEILLTSGSLQAMDLVNRLFLEKGDTVIVEESNYGGTFGKLNKIGAKMVAVPVDQGGMDVDALETVLNDLDAKGIKPKFIFSICTVHNPTGVIMPLERRKRLVAIAQERGIPIFEDECYSDLVWANERPPALRALDDTGLVVHIGTFSKTIGPALRVGYINADWPALGRLIAMKGDAGSPALEQVMLAEYCPKHFDAHLKRCNTALEAKLDALIAALDENFGTTIEYQKPPGGIFLWVKLPEGVKTSRLAAVAGEEGVAVNPGPEWSLGADNDDWIRLCFANPPEDIMRAGIAKLADICHREFGVPEISGNVRR